MVISNDFDWRKERLIALYESAKAAQGGDSLSIYGLVSDCLDLLDDEDEAGITMSERLFSRLRELGGTAN